MVLNKSFFTHAATLAAGLLGIVGIFAVHQFSLWQLDSSWRGFVEKSQTALRGQAEQIGFKFDLVGSNLRTLSLLPGLRDVDRYGENLDRNSRSAMQQIYNNLALQVDVSEVYVTPGEFNPDRLDPTTGRFEEPTIMFDELVVHEGRYSSSRDPFTDASVSSNKTSDIPEVESEEYRQLVSQIAMFKEKQPRFDLKNLRNLPFHSSEEVITCDNTEFAKTGHDNDRNGMLFSVPFYRSSGEFAGVVSAIIRSNAIRALLPERHLQLKAPNQLFANAAVPTSNGNLDVWRPSLVWPGADANFTLTTVFGSFDNQGAWELQRSLSSSDFYESPEFSLIRKTFWGSIAGILALVTFCFVWSFAARKRSAAIKFRASHDALTELPNRHLLDEKLQLAFGEAKRGQASFICYMDLDRFKAVNDTLGHQVGDAVIKHAAQRIKSCVRSTDIVARMGGDEFVVLLFDVGKGIVEVTKFAERVIADFKKPLELNGRNIDVGISMGIAAMSSSISNADDVIRQADLALFRAKTDERGCYRFYDKTMDDERLRRQKLASGLSSAIVNNELEIHYQLIVDAKTAAPKGCEALLRWHHPELGLVSPLEFIPLAEETGSIHKIGKWVLSQACMDALKMPKHFQLAVNVSPLQLQSQSFVLHVMAALGQSGLSPERLELEFTENVLVSASKATHDTIAELRRCGVQIALDDFGVGFSSLGYLKDFEFDRIKLDRSFLREVGSQKTEAVLKAVVGLGNSLGLSVTAEGVETEEQLNAVRLQGCTDVQGYFFSKPAKISQMLLEIEAAKLEKRSDVAS